MWRQKDGKRRHEGGDKATLRSEEKTGRRG